MIYKLPMMREKSKSENYENCIALYNRLLSSYNDIRDEWYHHTYLQLEKLLRYELRQTISGSSLLDVGCGTGLQTILYSEMGGEVIGIDINPSLIHLANYKLEQLYFEPTCFCASAEYIPFKNESFDVVSCCGDVLNYVHNPDLCLTEMTRVLKHDGTIILGFGNRVSFDVIWIMIDSILLRGKLHYNNRFGDVIRDLLNVSKPHWNSYPLITNEGVIEQCSLRFFTSEEIKKKLRRTGIQILRVYGINTIMNLLPYTILSNPSMASRIHKFTMVLAKVDSCFARHGVFKMFASDLLIFGRKE